MYIPKLYRLKKEWKNINICLISRKKRYGVEKGDNYIIKWLY